jgi:hypothetical protein
MRRQATISHDEGASVVLRVGRRRYDTSMCELVKLYLARRAQSEGGRKGGSAPKTQRSIRVPLIFGRGAFRVLP